MNCVILYNRVFERYEVFMQSHPTPTGRWFNLFDSALEWIAINAYTEVPINSAAGKRILARIGGQTTEVQ